MSLEALEREEAAMLIAGKLLEEICAHLRRELPREGWGIVASRHGKLAKVYPMKNTAPDAHHRYSCDPQELYDVLKSIQGEGMEMALIYHSHPPTSAYFSATDLAEAWVKEWDMPAYPGVRYLVIGFEGGSEPVDIKLFRLVDGVAVEEELQISEKGEAL